jgi:AcrR family transcriptional regulator
MPRNFGRPTRDVATALPDLILDAAQLLFLTQGFEATSLNQIAAAASVTKRTLYAKFGAKEDIFAAAVRRMLDRRREMLIDPGIDVPIGDRLIQFGEGALSVGLDPAVLDLCRVVIAEARRFPALAALMDEQVMHGVRERLIALLQDEIAHGRLRTEDPTLAAELLQNLIVGAGKLDSLFGTRSWTKKQRTRWVKGAVRLFLDGYRAK